MAPTIALATTLLAGRAAASHGVGLQPSLFPRETQDQKTLEEHTAS